MILWRGEEKRTSYSECVGGELNECLIRMNVFVVTVSHESWIDTLKLVTTIFFILELLLYLNGREIPLQWPNG